jgi:hypothetical protein
VALADSNPYQPPEVSGSPSEASGTATHPTGWRLVPAVFCFCLGFASFCFGLFAVAVMLYVLLIRKEWSFYGGMLAGCSLYLGFGIAWMLAGWLYWQRRFGFGLIATLLGMLIPVTLFAVFGV